MKKGKGDHNQKYIQRSEYIQETPAHAASRCNTKIASFSLQINTIPIGKMQHDDKNKNSSLNSLYCIKGWNIKIYSLYNLEPSAK